MTSIRAAKVLRGLVATALVAVLLATPDPAVAAPPPPLPASWPLAGPAPVLRPFDPPDQPWGRGNRGVDLEAAVGDAVLATAAGRVTYAGVLAGRGVLVVTHGALRTTYEPVTSLVAVGTTVTAGQIVGRLTAGVRCGASACLHWGLRQGDRYLDPLSGATAPQQQPELQSSGEVRLLPASARAVAQRRAATRAAVRAAAAAARVAALLSGDPGTTGPPARAGAHGFLAPVSGALTSGFGRRFHPVLKVWKQHDGTDFGAPCGSPIRAPAAGVVTRSVFSTAYGHRLFLDHGQAAGRHVVTSYNHATRFVVPVGDQVTPGQVIGYVGATGYATGCHLHLMIWLDGRLTDPMAWW
jgi:murein DD-endopeptidase MepM/ murein hydrolase activator NlpD